MERPVLDQLVTSGPKVFGRIAEAPGPPVGAAGGRVLGKEDVGAAGTDQRGGPPKSTEPWKYRVTKMFPLASVVPSGCHAKKREAALSAAPPAQGARGCYG